MKYKEKSPRRSFNNSNKDTNIYQQQQIVFEYLKYNVSTMLMVAKATNIERASICRYVAKLKKENRIYAIRIGLCEITKHKAVYYGGIR